MMHDFDADPQSGAGNCTCGAQRHHRRHRHPYMTGAIEYGAKPDVCVCGLAPEADCHFVITGQLV